MQNQKPWQYLVYAIYPASFIFVPHAIKFIEHAKSRNIPTAEYNDIALVIGSAIFQYFLYLTIRRNFQRLIFENLEERYQGQERVLRVEKISKLLYDTIFYVSSTIFAYYFFGNTFIIPKSLGGVGECSELFQGYPHKPQIPYFNEFYLYQMGNHLYRLIHHWITSKADGNFWEMHLHHWIAFWLIAYSYLMNYTSLGGIVMILHDLADIFFSSGRVYDSLRNKIKVLWYSCAVAIMISWNYTRLIFYPTCVIKVCWDHMGTDAGSWEILQNPYYFLFSLLLILLVLHAYWMVIFIKVAAAPGSKKAVIRTKVVKN
jgi:hypothetical protein